MSDVDVERGNEPKTSQDKLGVEVNSAPPKKGYVNVLRWAGGSTWTRAFDAYSERNYEFRAFEALHLFSIKTYERELIKLANRVVQDTAHPRPDAVTQIREQLKLYCEAVDRLEKVLGRRITASKVPGSQNFILEAAFKLEERASYTPSNDPIRKTLGDILPKRYRSKFLENVSSKLSLTGMLVRFMVAFFGGASLLVPMIVMTFRTSRTARLVTVCVATLLFAYAIALLKPVNKQDILGATAAYAAVMVVYVGTALPSSS
ncbi:hypothetical protein LTR56_008933 [Elasticomyces elasticus]|nr:hypothetical protein LTR56_008933 [Elasticomyces elasticus]KAK3663163.1 hypothetical protein LTR22_006072 [Elasticomyces elasticus]KAK4924060.1 hypothetical protein LTR49_008800 [Elasticomyces elasticus]KAK5764418.1 hypothetical protein LTS12_005394 [Elasticomyces elasticus]